MATPKDRTYESMSDQPNLLEFEWDITATPEEFSGFRPSAQIIIDSRKVDPTLLEEIEEFLYGSSSEDPSLPTMAELVSYITGWHRIEVVDNGDGTWTAISRFDEDILIDGTDETLFTIFNADATHLGEGLFEISTN